MLVKKNPCTVLPSDFFNAAPTYVRKNQNGAKFYLAFLHRKPAHHFLGCTIGARLAGSPTVFLYH